MLICELAARFDPESELVTRCRHPLDCLLTGHLPVGVVFKKRDNRYYAQMNIDGVMRHLGSYSSPEDAFLAYKEKREERIKMIAEENKSKISEKIYKNLMSWEVSPF